MKSLVKGESVWQAISLMMFGLPIFSQEGSALGLGLEAIIQIGSTAGLGALAWYLIVKVNPESDERHRKEREAEHTRWREERENFLAVIVNRDTKFLEALEKRDAYIENINKEWITLVLRLEVALNQIEKIKRENQT